MSSTKTLGEESAASDRSMLRKFEQGNRPFRRRDRGRRWKIFLRVEA